MKKFRPYRAGFIVLYVLSLLCISEAIYTLISQLRGTSNDYMQSFSLFSYLIAFCAVMFVKMYIVTRIEIDKDSFHFVNPVYIHPQPGAKRSMILYRQGDTDIRLVDKRFRFDGMEKYGYIEDLGYAQLDKSNAGQKNKLFPVHEIALVMKDGKRYHVNGGSYSDKQLAEIVNLIYQNSGIRPEGRLAELIAK